MSLLKLPVLSVELCFLLPPMDSKGEKAMRMLVEVMKLIKLNFNKIKDDLTQVGANKVCLICSGLPISYLGFITETTSEGLSLSYLSVFSVWATPP